MAHTKAKNLNLFLADFQFVGVEDYPFFPTESQILGLHIRVSSIHLCQAGMLQLGPFVTSVKHLKTEFSSSFFSSNSFSIMALYCLNALSVQIF